MSVKIGHASMTSTGGDRNDIAGDQTGKEVCVREWYKHKNGWDVVLRPKNKAVAEGMAMTCERACANDKIGYDKNGRNTLWNQMKVNSFNPSKITKACECDCSSLMTVCAIAGGANIPYGTNAPTTSTMRAVFKASGNFDVLTDKKYLESDEYLKRGDIIVAEGSHTVMVLSDGVTSNSIQPTISTKTLSLPTGTLKKGSSGANVKKLQTALNELFKSNITVDGDFGQNTFNALKDAQAFLYGALIYKSTIDGVYGENTRNAMITYASTLGITIK